MRLPGARRLAALSYRRRVFVLGMSAVAAAAATTLGLAAGGVLSGPPPRGGSGRGVVVLVPGYGDGTAGIDVLAAHVRTLHLTAEVVALPDHGTGDLGAQAAVLNGYVTRALRTGASQVDVVGYSAGGVVTRLWDAYYRDALQVRRVVTLGSPLNGTRIAAAGAGADPGACPEACQELVPGSSLLTRLNTVALGTRPGWLSLWTTDDQVVRPPGSARLAGAVNVPLQSVCPDLEVTHEELPSDSLVIGIVLRALGPGPLTAPPRADCDRLQTVGSRPVRMPKPTKGK